MRSKVTKEDLIKSITTYNRLKHEIHLAKSALANFVKDAANKLEIGYENDKDVLNELEQRLLEEVINGN